MTTRSSRTIAILTGGAVATSMFVSAAPVRADKANTYKTGAIALGAVAIYSIIKGKELPAAIAGAGAYYAYKKSKDAQNDPRYSDNSGNVYPGDVYADNGSYNSYPDSQPNYGQTYPDSQPYYGNTGDDYYGNDPYYTFGAQKGSRLPAATVRPSIRLK